MSGLESQSVGPDALTGDVAAASGPSRGRLALASALVGVATLILMLATEPMLAIVWDEGYTLGREARLRAWFGALRDPAGSAATWAPPAIELVQQQGAPLPPPDRRDTLGELLFDPEVLAWFWPFAREEPHGHPPFYALLGLTGDVLTPGRSDLQRGRLGPILLFSITAGLLFRSVARRWGWWAAAASAGAWALHPHLFAHGHYASYDGPLTCLWLLTILAFVAGRESGRLAWAGAFGVALGCAMADKLTGWFIPIPFLAWAAVYRDRRALRFLVVGGLVGLATTYLLQPPWWTEPIAGPYRFFRSNLSRGETIPIPVQFLGTIYNTPRESLPPYNTIVLTVFCTPVVFLALGLAGAWRAVRRWKVEPILLLFLAHWAFLLLLRAMPRTPGHDGVRLFLPAFGVLALLAGPGAEQLRAWIGGASRWVVGLGLAEGAVAVAVMMPVPLSYYSPIVGGLPGATRLGMEPTFYWDALDDGARAFLRENTPPGRTIRFATFPHSWIYLRDTGELPRAIAPIDPGVPLWYVVQNRPGALSAWDRALLGRERTAYAVSKLGVPLVWVFRHEDLERAIREAAR
ncbi:glycosyltransferase family 39 protein [Paludisphaera sp.]|uniref:ArnT family glycosyltransferase n=1 Tax=Paludisphaera sp. TaxID=2017432 RepID=UPI00301BC0A0